MTDQPRNRSRCLGHLPPGRLREADIADYAATDEILVTSTGRQAMTRGIALLSDALAARLSRLSGTEQGQLKSQLENMG